MNGIDGMNQSMEADDAHQWGGKVIGRDGVNQSMEADDAHQGVDR